MLASRNPLNQTESNPRMEQLNSILAMRREMVIEFLELLRTKGYSKGLCSGDLFRAICRHFDVYVARCKECHKYYGREDFPHWAAMKGVALPRYFTKLICFTCKKDKMTTHPSRQCRKFQISMQVNGEPRIYYVAARRKREAFSLLFRANYHQLDPALADEAALLYQGLPADIQETRRNDVKAKP